MATYDLKYPGAAIDAILDTAYHLQQAGYIFRGSASDYSGTPTEREWVIAPAGFSGLGLSSAVPKGSIGICLYNGTSWTGKIINVLTLDSAPTRNSQNGVTSGGVAATLDEIAGGIMATFASLLFDDETAAADLSTKLSYAVKFSVSDVYQTVTHLNILAATTSKAGLLSAADKVKIDSFLTNLRSLTFTDTTASADQGTQITETLKATIGGVQEVIDSITILAATSSKAGLLSASDKAYIDALPSALTNLSNSISAALALMESLVGYYTCDTAAATAAKTVAATGYSLTNGGCIRIKMTNANTAANVTLNINSTGAKALYYDGAQASSTNTWEAGEVLEVYYDGTQYQCASGGGGKFATGQKVKEIGITNTVSNSDDLVTAGGVNSAISKKVEETMDSMVLKTEPVAISNNNWVTADTGSVNQYSKSIPLHSGHRYTITARAKNVTYAVVTAIGQAGTAVSYATGWSGTTSVSAGNSVTIDGIEGCYLYMRFDIRPSSGMVGPPLIKDTYYLTTDEIVEESKYTVIDISHMAFFGRKGATNASCLVADSTNADYGKIVSAAGAYQAMSTSDYIYIGGSRKIHVTVPSNKSYGQLYGLCFYTDKNDASVIGSFTMQRNTAEQYYLDFPLEVPSTAKYIRTMWWTQDSTNADKNNFSLRCEVKINRLCEDALWKSSMKSAMKGKKLSIIGDSISTFQGWTPSSRIAGYDGASYATFYPSWYNPEGLNYAYEKNVGTVEDTWWWQLCEVLGLELLSNAAWSASHVCGDSLSTSSAEAGCSTRRITDLAMDGKTPDIIICWIGINDFGWISGGARYTPLGDWSSRSHALPEESNNVATFSEGYALMVYKAMQAYPKAKIYCCTLLQTGYSTKDHIGTGVWPTENIGNLTIEEYNDVIRDVAHGLGAELIDLSNCGINFWNFSEFLGDALHPNYYGMRIVQNAIANALLCKQNM